MDIQFRPRVKEGIGLGGARLAQMVRVTGPLTDPKLGVDFEGVVGATVSIAAGVATAGLSILGEQLLATGTDENACKIASGSASPQAAPTAGRSRSKEPAADQPAAQEPSAKEPPEKKERGFFDKIFGK